MTILLTIMTIVLAVVLVWAIAYGDYQHKLVAWCDEREKVTIPLIACVQAIHLAGTPRHGTEPIGVGPGAGIPGAAIDGVTSDLVEVKVDPASAFMMPDAENWVVQGNHVYVKRSKPEFMPSQVGLRQIELLQDMEKDRAGLVQRLRDAYIELVEWEQTHPVPEAPWRRWWKS